MDVIKAASSFILPAIIFLVGIIFLFSKKDYFSSFKEGAKDGLKTALGLLPTMCALSVSIAIFSSSGIADFIASIFAPVCDFLKIPSEIFSFALTKPLSGGASMATYEALLSEHGADSFIGICSSIIMASSDTIFYVMCIYFSTSRVSKTKYAVPCAVLVFIFCIVFSSLLTRIFF